MIIQSKAELRQIIAADMFRYLGRCDKKAIRRGRRRGAACFCYYLRKSMYAGSRPLLRHTLYYYYSWRRVRAAFRCGAEIPVFGGDIGGGLHLAHNGAIVVHANAVLGRNVTLSTGVVVGQTLKDGKVLTPVVGNNVYIAPGAKIIGGVRVGNDVVIGANAVVTKDVPDHAVAAGVPARVLSYEGARDYLMNPYLWEEDK
ncbi:MAG: serine acetyltransferase [Oscillospiraceae bacterium]|nr:serine acetyltransferase [Oscillospiraceae bacterium]